MRRALSEDEQQRIATEIVDHLKLANYRVESGPLPPAGEGTGKFMRGRSNDETQT